jgi:hypothetical protein
MTEAFLQAYEEYQRKNNARWWFEYLGLLYEWLKPKYEKAVPSKSGEAELFDHFGAIISLMHTIDVDTRQRMSSEAWRKVGLVEPFNP